MKSDSDKLHSILLLIYYIIDSHIPYAYFKNKLWSKYDMLIKTQCLLNVYITLH